METDYPSEALRCFKLTLRIRQLFQGQQLFQPAWVVVKEPSHPKCTNLTLEWDGIRNIVALYKMDGVASAAALTINGKPKDDYMLFMVDLLKNLHELHTAAVKARDFATVQMKEASDEAEVFLLKVAPPAGD